MGRLPRAVDAAEIGVSSAEIGVSSAEIGVSSFFLTDIAAINRLSIYGTFTKSD
jgi:hypothetical protein